MMDDLDYSLESFVEKVELPHRAKVTEGYYEPGDQDGDREFSNGEILEVRRIICPFVDITFTHPGTRRQTTITVSTRSQDLRFRVITQQHAQGLVKSRVFCSLQEVIDVWPNSIMSASEHVVQIPGVQSGKVSRGEELRLIRVINDDRSALSLLELKSNSTKRLVQLPAALTGQFYECEDPKSYTLQELVDMARVERFLQLDVSKLDKKTVHVRGLPSDFEGTLKMQKPQVLVEIARVLVKETNGEEYTGTPLLAPINCDIKLVARDVAYMPLPFETCHLSSIAESPAENLPFVARVVAWKEETAILQNQVTRPGNHLVIYSRTSVDKILARGGERYFLIPTYHKGCFKEVSTGDREPKEVKLESLENKPFPLEVQYFNTSEYRNTTDDHLPLNERLVFERFVKGEPCVVVSKLFGDVIGTGFHLPLRTKITIRMERRWKKSVLAPKQMSHLDCCSEEISQNLYHEIMRTNEYEYVSTSDGTRIKKRVPPVVPPRPSPGLADRTRAPLPPTVSFKRVKTGKRNDEDDSDDDYDYVDAVTLSLPRPESFTEEDMSKGIVEIPSNGNISGFSADQMVFFLRENHAPYKTISDWRRDAMDGMTFATMTDEKLKSQGIGTPVIQFFRDRSKMQLVLAHL